MEDEEFEKIEARLLEKYTILKVYNDFESQFRSTVIKLLVYGAFFLLAYLFMKIEPLKIFGFIKD